MTPTPSSGPSPQDNNARSNSTGSFKVAKKRNRVPLSCAPCRSRKLKCNRSHPCENCVRRGDPLMCTYATTPHGSSRVRRSSGNASSSDEMQSRIDRLEGLVLGLMGSVGDRVSSSDREGSMNYIKGGRPGSNDEDDVGMGSDGNPNSGAEGESDGDVEEVRSALGIMRMDRGKSFYRGETHWAVILSEISEVKNYFSEVKQCWEDKFAQLRAKAPEGRFERAGFPFSACRPPSREELIALVPRRELADLLVDGFFRNYDPVFHVLHRPTFYKQYRDFWRDPDKVDVLWLALLMAIMCLSLKIYHWSGEEPPELGGKAHDMSHAFRLATEQCLIVGEFTKRMYLHTVQTLILVCTWQSSKDQIDDTWLFLGMLTRLAMSMGLHRDPKHFGTTISPSEAEIRRRVWMIIYCMDVLESIKIGLPSMIREEECDTTFPLNLHDDEIGDDIDILPPERPKEELTGVSYILAKAALSRVYFRIVAQANSLGPRPGYDQILKMDAELRELNASIPLFLRLKPTVECKDDPAWLIIQRYSLDIITQKALITLHRPYAARAQRNHRYERSRQKCVESAMILLRHQAEIVLDTQSVLKHARWFTEGLGCYDYIHAAMIISLDLSTQCRLARERSVREGEQGFLKGAEERAEQYRVLERAKMIYAKEREGSIDATKAYDILTALLDRVRGGGSGYFDFALGCVTKVKSNTEATYHASAPRSSVGSPSDMSTPVFATPSSTTASEAVNTPAGVVKEEHTSSSMMLEPLASEGANIMSPNSAAVAGMLFNAQSPGGHNVVMTDASGGVDIASPGGLSSISSFWAQMDSPNDLDWDEWDNIMRADLGTAQTTTWPIMGGGLSAAAFNALDMNENLKPPPGTGGEGVGRHSTAPGPGYFVPDGVDMGV